MKYIRTSKGIWEISKLSQNDYEWLCKGEHIESNFLDNLFDTLVAVPHHKEMPILGKIEIPDSGDIEYPMFLNQTTGWYHDLYSFVAIYGAIWTDKGLKYVARMDKDERFRLL